ncbi:MAG: 50S ribosomal protein L22 [Aquificae bacterium]|nr:50S ribosomal protein L22 [Aquificota bacterium]
MAETVNNEARAVLRYAKTSPTKARQIINVIRGKDVGTALALLHGMNKRAARIVEGVLRSAIANAELKEMDVDRLYIKDIRAEDGPILKRYMPRAYGRATPKKRRYSHIYIILAERT